MIPPPAFKIVLGSFCPYIRHQKKDTQIFALTEYGISVNIHIEKLVPFSETSLFYISRY